jgi:serine O-acetyltransferase
MTEKSIMAITSHAAPGGNIEAYDPIWQAVRAEAEDVMAAERALGGFIYATVLAHERLEDAICHRLAQRLNHADVDAGLIGHIFADVLNKRPDIGRCFRADLAAVYDRDPACHRYIEPLLYFKGFHALVTHRFAHALWVDGRQDFALYLQSQSSRIFGVDIHPAARIGRGLMFDHATGIVVGETAVIGDHCSLLHGVTLGGSGKEGGDRHPRTCRRSRRSPACRPASSGRRAARSRRATWTSACSPTTAAAAEDRKRSDLGGRSRLPAKERGMAVGRGGARGNALTKEEIGKLQTYLRKVLANKSVEVRARERAVDAAEVYIAGEFVALVSKDLEDGETCYQLNMTILDYDLEGDD